jgi:acylpyruvate hydrolase
VRLATVRVDGADGVDGADRVARIDGDDAVLLPYRTMEELLADPGWRAVVPRASGRRLPTAELRYRPVVTAPAKVICVGLNYRSHILEMGRDLPEAPTLFAKFANSLIGAHDDVLLPPESEQVDWEVELALVVGRPVRRVPPKEAAQAIAGFTVLNDVSMRDWQWRTTEWLQGKTFERSTPLGPHLVTLDELDDPGRLAVQCRVNDEIVQEATTDDLLFPPAELVAYVSRFTTLVPGDVIATGTPGGVGAARTPPRFLQPGDHLTTSIAGVGTCSNHCLAEPA